MTVPAAMFGMSWSSAARPEQVRAQEWFAGLSCDSIIEGTGAISRGAEPARHS